MISIFSFDWHHVLQHFCWDMYRNQTFGLESDLSLDLQVLLMFFRLFFSLSCTFLAAVIDLLLDLLPDQKFLRKHLYHRLFLPWSSWVYFQEILLQVFHSNFWACLCTSQASLSQSLWSRYHWKVQRSFPPAKLEYRWCQFWVKSDDSTNRRHFFDVLFNIKYFRKKGGRPNKRLFSYVQSDSFVNLDEVGK